MRKGGSHGSREKTEYLIITVVENAAITLLPLTVLEIMLLKNLICLRSLEGGWECWHGVCGGGLMGGRCFHCRSAAESKKWCCSVLPPVGLSISP